MRTFHAGCVPKLLVASAFAAACVVTLKARWALADLGDGKPMTPSGLTVSIESCAKAAPGNGMDPAVQLAYCACVTDYMDGLRPKAARSLAKGIAEGNLPSGFVAAAKKCGRWAQRVAGGELDRTPYSRRKVTSAFKTMTAYLACEKTDAARAKGGLATIQYCDRVIAAVRKD